MPFSVRSGVCLMYLTVLLSLPEQGCPQCYRPGPRGPGSPVIPPCCMGVSNATIKERIVSCIEQRETTFAHCKVHAFIFVTVSQAQYCVDPAASWLKRRFERLQNREICCDRL
ncbi:uncharacterized protein ABDE67_019921 [Symphorus nematophorus]